MPASKRLTHFLCLPLVTGQSRPQLEAAFKAFTHEFKDEQTSDSLNPVPRKAIRPIGTLHFTLGMMSLLTQERIDTALRVLHSLDLVSMLDNSSKPDGKSQVEERDSSQISTASPLKVTLRGLTSMHEPKKTSILYAKPAEPSSVLQRFCLDLQKKFLEEYLLVADDRPLLLHATILNTIYVPGVRRHGGGHGMHKAKMTFDAREILQQFQDLVWMEDVVIEKVAICRMGASKILDEEGKETGDEAYIVVGEVDMPLMTDDA